MSVTNMSWSAFSGVNRNAPAVERLAAVGVPDRHWPAALTRIRVDKRGSKRIVILRLVVNRERLLLVSRSGFARWLDARTNGNPRGYLVVRVEVDESVSELTVLSFRFQDRFALGTEKAADIRVVQQQWVTSAAMDPGGERDAGPALEALHRTLAMNFFIMEGAQDPRDELLPGAFVEVHPLQRATAEPPPERVQASASADMPEHVPIDAAFELVVTLNGPNVEPAVPNSAFTALKDVPVTVQVLRLQNVALVAGDDPTIRAIPPAGASILIRFALRRRYTLNPALTNRN